MFKTKLKLLLLISCFFIFAVPAFASSNTTVNILLNSKAVTFTESSGYPYVDENNRTMVPLRATMEAAGFAVGYDANSRTAIVITEKNRIEVPLGTNKIYTNNQLTENDTIAVIKNSRTYLPIRAVLEKAGYTVEWAGDTKTVNAYTFSYDKDKFVPYSASSPSALLENVLNGNVLYVEGQYYTTPDYVKEMTNEIINYSGSDLNTSTFPQANKPAAKIEWYSNDPLNALLGDLNSDISKTAKAEIEEAFNQVTALRESREKNKDYKMSDEESKLWADITALLDEETMRQFSIEGNNNNNAKVGYAPVTTIDYGKQTMANLKNTLLSSVKAGSASDANVDYGKETMANLKNTLSAEDWEKLNTLRNDYFDSMANPDKEYDVNFEAEVRAIAKKYDTLDADAVTLNVLDEKTQQNIGMFTITSDHKAVYQDGSKNGLKSLSAAEQAELEKKWKLVIDILPDVLFANFKYFKVGGDGEGNTCAYVIRVDDQGKTWALAVDPDDITSDGIFPYTIVHEMAHYLTLNEQQVTYPESEENYPLDIFSGAGCVAKEGSYLQEYYNIFWKNITNDRATNPENEYFYYRHQSEFVTEYASTSCTEDMAETFSAYVLSKAAATPLIQKKFDFFDSYPELKKIKEDILLKIKNNEVKVNDKIELDAA